ncbi:MAG: hypothetical protein J6Y62_08375 [Clostridia bacterium]|nr:hypothetical protein [Clostridia bacterium]
MANTFSMGYLANGNGAIEGVEYSEDFAQLHGDIVEGVNYLKDALDENTDMLNNTIGEQLGAILEEQQETNRLLRELIDRFELSL